MEWFIYLIIFLAPAYAVRFEILSIPTTLLEISIYVLFAARIIYIKKWGEELKNWKIFWQKNKIETISFFLIFFGALISAVFSSGWRVSFGIFKAYFSDPLIFLFVLISVFLSQTSKHKTAIFQKNILNSIIASGTAISTLALWSANKTFSGRLLGFYSSPNYFAMYLSPALLVSLFMLFREISRNFNFARSLRFYILFASVPIIFAAVYKSLSYGAFVGLAGSAVIYFIFSAGPKKQKFLFAAAALLIFLAVFSAQINTEKFQSLFKERSPVQSRFVIMKSALKIIKDNWLFGIGPGMFQEKYLRYQKYFPPYPEWAAPQPHNVFFAFLLQTGLLGFLGFMSLIFFLAKKSLKSLQKTNDDDLAAIFILFLSYFLIHGLADTPFWKNDLAFLFWLFCGLAALNNVKNSVAKER